MKTKTNLYRVLLTLLVALIAVPALFAAGQSEDAATGPEKVTLRFASNLPDRSSGQGLLEQKQMDKYLAAHPEVEFDTEYLQDEAYKQKLKVYTASNSLPDVFMIWPSPSYIAPMLANDLLEPLTETAAYPTDLDFMPGALDRFTHEGKIYGYSGNFDFFVLFYNEALFQEHNVKVPTTYNELMSAIKAFQAKGIAPVAGNGKDRWPASGMFGEIAIKYTGSQNVLFDAVDEVGFSENPDLLKAAQLYNNLVEAEMYPGSFISADYGTAKNQFTQGNTAMWYIGSWEMSMKADETLDAAFRENLNVTHFPVINGGKGKITDLYGWNGRGYVVSSGSENPEVAKGFLNYIFKPENWAKDAWQMGVYVPAQRYERFFTGSENSVQKKISEMANSLTSSTGVFWTNCKTAAFKTDADSAVQALAAGVYSPEELLEVLDEAAAKVEIE